MSRFYTGDSNSLETLKVELSNVKQSQTFNEKLAEQKKEIVFLTQYDDYIKNFINNGINKYKYFQQQAKSEYRKDVSMLKTEFDTFRNSYLNIFKMGMNMNTKTNLFLPCCTRLWVSKGQRYCCKTD